MAASSDDDSVVSLFVSIEYDEKGMAKPFEKLLDQYNYIMSKFSCVDAYFLYKRQKIYISNLIDGVFGLQNPISFVEYSLDYLLLFFIKRKPDNAKSYDYITDIFNNQVQISLPKSWISTEPIYNSATATTRGADNSLYQLQLLGNEVVASTYASSNSIYQTGGVSITFEAIDESGRPKQYYKRTNDGKPYGFKTARIIDPEFMEGMQVFHDATLTEITIIYTGIYEQYLDTITELSPTGVSTIYFKIPTTTTLEPVRERKLDIDVSEDKIFFAQALKKPICGNTLYYVDRKFKPENRFITKENIVELTIDKLENEIVGITKGYFSFTRQKIINRNSALYIPTDRLFFESLRFSNNIEKILIRFKEEQIESTSLTIDIKNVIGLSLFFNKATEIKKEKIQGINKETIVQPFALEQYQNLLFEEFGAKEEILYKDEFNIKILNISTIREIFLNLENEQVNISFLRLKNNIVGPNYSIEISDFDAYNKEIEKIYSAVQSNYSRALAYENDPFKNVINFMYDAFDFNEYYNIELEPDVTIIYNEVSFFEREAGLYESEWFNFPTDFFKNYKYFTCLTFPVIPSYICCSLVGNYRNELPIVNIANKRDVIYIAYKLNALPRFKFYSNGEWKRTIVMSLMR